MKKVLLTAAIIAVITGCSKNETEKQTNPDNLAEIQLSSAPFTGSKAAIDGDVAIDGLQFLRADVPVGQTGSPSFTGKTPIVGSRTKGSGNIVFEIRQKYAATDRAYFASYYPAGRSAAADIISWSVDGKTDILTADAIDAGTYQSHASVAPLQYNHELAQIEVICKAEIPGTGAQDRWGNIKSITLKNALPSMTYDYATLKTTPAGVPSNILLLGGDYTTIFAPTPMPASTNESATAAGMFIAGSQTFDLEIVTAGPAGGADIIIPVAVDLGAGNALTKGKKHKITLTFKAVASIKDAIIITSDIAEWKPGTPGSGNVE